jgi:hypothetical protein
VTPYAPHMAMLSFEATDAEARAVQAWADALGVDPSVLLREALRLQLVRLASGPLATTPAAPPLSAAEQALADAADWGPEEDWSAWADAGRGE